METEEKFEIVFRGEALKRLKAVASEIDIPDDRLGDVLLKAFNLFDMARVGSNLTVMKGKNIYDVDLKKL